MGNKKQQHKEEMGPLTRYVLDSIKELIGGWLQGRRERSERAERQARMNRSGEAKFSEKQHRKDLTQASKATKKQK